MKNHCRRRPLGQRITDTIGAGVLAVLIFPFVVACVRDDRRGGGQR